MKARAVVFPEAHRVELRDVTLREIAPDEVLVATAYSSISAGTERLLFDGKLPAIPHLRYPLVPGYEAVGTVVTAGADVHDVVPGDAVFVGGSMCYTDVAAAFGGQSSHLVKRASQVIPLRGIPPAEAPLLALAATSLHGVRRLGDVRGKRVLVLGLGAVGQFAVAYLRASGAHVVAADRAAERLAAADADERIDVSDATLEAQLGEPVDAAVEATGRSGELARCARVLRNGGSIAVLSYYDTLEVPYPELFVKEVTLLACREWAPDDLVAARDLAADGSVPLGRLATSVVPVGAYADAYRCAFDDPSVLKVVLQWA